MTSPSEGAVSQTQMADQITVLNNAYASSGFQFTLSSYNTVVNASWYTVNYGSAAP